MVEWSRTSEDQWLHYWSRGLQLGVADPEGTITGVEEPTTWISDSMIWPDEEDEEVVDEGYEADIDGEDEEDEEKEVEGPQDEGLGGEDSEDDDEDGSEDEDDDEDD